MKWLSQWQFSFTTSLFTVKPIIHILINTNIDAFGKTKSKNLFQALIYIYVDYGPMRLTW